MRYRWFPGGNSSTPCLFFGRRRMRSAVVAAVTVLATAGTGAAALAAAGPPGTPGSLGVSPDDSVRASSPVTASARPTLSAVAADPDGGNLSYTFELVDERKPDSVESATVGEVPSGQSAEHRTRVLPSPGIYRFRVKASDGLDESAWSGWKRFTVDAPEIPSGLATGLADPRRPILSGIAARPSAREVTGRFFLFDSSGRRVGPSPLGTGVSVFGKRLTLRVPDGLVEPGRLYFWRMQACVGDTCSGQTNSVTFTVPQEPSPPSGKEAVVGADRFTVRSAAVQADACDGASCPLTPQTAIQAGGQGAARRASVFRVDTGAIPDGARIVSAQLHLGGPSCSGACPDGAKVAVHALREGLPDDPSGKDLMDGITPEAEASLDLDGATLDVTGLVSSWRAEAGDESAFVDPGLVVLADETVPAVTFGQSGGEATRLEIEYIDPAPPGKISKLSARPGDSGLVVAWGAPDEPGAATERDGYNVQVLDSGGTVVASLTQRSRRAVIGDLANDTRYQVRVRARNAFGAGDWSAAAQVSTRAVDDKQRYVEMVRDFVAAREGLADGRYADAAAAVAQSPSGRAIGPALHTVEGETLQARDKRKAAGGTRSTSGIQVSDPLVSWVADDRVTVRATVRGKTTYTDQVGGSPETTTSDWSENVEFVVREPTYSAPSGFELGQPYHGGAVDAQVDVSRIEVNVLAAGEPDPSRLPGEEGGSPAPPGTAAPGKPGAEARAIDRTGIAAWAVRNLEDSSEWEYGEDCTNFVSRAMHHGGGARQFLMTTPIVWEGRKDNKNWFEAAVWDSYSWAAVVHHFDHHVNQRARITWRQTVSEVQVGDIMYWRKSDGSLFHMSVVTKKTTNASDYSGLYLTQHGLVSSAHTNVAERAGGYTIGFARVNW